MRDTATTSPIVVNRRPKVNAIDIWARLQHCRAVTMVRNVRANGIAWREAGNGEPVLLLHGLGGSRTSWDPQLIGLADRARAMAWDLPGYGESPALRSALTFETLAAAVVRWAGILNLTSFHLVGHSLGGMIAQYVAALHPDRVRTLTLLSTSPKFGLDGTEPDAWRAARLAPLDAGQQPADFADVVLRRLARADTDDAVIASQVSAMSRIPADGLRRVIDVLVTHDSRAVLADITAPTVVAVGADDDGTPLAYARALVDAIPGARLSVIDGAAHLLPAEAPNAVTALIAAQLKAVR
jgi:3-oxoadipate enol-lactonase